MSEARPKPTARRGLFRVVLLVPVALGFLLALGLAAEQYVFRSGAVRVVGTVVAHEYTESEQMERRRGITSRRKVISRYAYYVVEYSDAAGRTYRAKSTVGSGEARHAVGAKVGVYFEPDNPGAARFDDALEIWFTPTLVMGMTLGVVLIVWLIARKLVPRPPPVGS